LRKNSEGGIPPAGSLRNYSLSNILTSLLKQNKTGILTLEHGVIQKNIYIENGHIVFSSSNREDDRLGEKLVRSDRITLEQRDESLRLAKESNKLYGMTLLDLGYILPKDLFLELKTQITDIILPLFTWEDGQFRFQENDLSGIVRLKLNTEDLIQEGISRAESKKKEDVRALTQEIETLYRQINTMNYYDILDVGIKSSSAEIKKAYLKKVSKFHPDRHRYLPRAVEDKLGKIFSFMNSAYKTLSTEDGRNHYDTSLLKKSTQKTPDVNTIKAAEQFQRGVAEYNKGDFWGAADFLHWATKQCPEKAAYWAHLSLALSKIPRKSKEAEESILKAIELEPHNAGYYVHLGIIYLQSGMKRRAVRQFITALTWDPNNDRALSELEKLEKFRDDK
jgi:tetratricopeptide (TPR) repeat protein